MSRRIGSELTSMTARLNCDSVMPQALPSPNELCLLKRPQLRRPQAVPRPEALLGLVGRLLDVS